MARLTGGLAQNSFVHVAFAFLMMGGWAFYANAQHPSPGPIIAGLVQGTLSGGITLALKRTLDALRARIAHRHGWWGPPLIALGGSLCLLITAHLLAGTPEVFRTIIVPYSVSVLYAVTYNFIIWHKGETP